MVNLRYAASLVRCIFDVIHLCCYASLAGGIFGKQHIWCNASMVCWIFGALHIGCNIFLLHCIFGASHLLCICVYELLVSLVVPRWWWLLLCNASLAHCFLALGAIYFWCCIFGAMHCQLYRAGLLPQWRICFIPDNDTLIFGVPNSYFPFSIGFFSFFRFCDAPCEKEETAFICASDGSLYRFLLFTKIFKTFLAKIKIRNKCEMLRAHCGRHVYQVGGIFLLPYSSTSDLLEQVWRV